MFSLYFWLSILFVCMSLICFLYGIYLLFSLILKDLFSSLNKLRTCLTMHVFICLIYIPTVSLMGTQGGFHVGVHLLKDLFQDAFMEAC